MRLIWRAGCPPLFGVAKTESAATPQEDAACRAANARIEQAFRADPPPGLLLVGRWSYYAEGGGVGLDAHNRITLDAPYDRSVRQTLDQLAAAGSRIWVMRQVPEIPGYSALGVARAMARAEPVPPSRFFTPGPRPSGARPLAWPLPCGGRGGADHADRPLAAALRCAGMWRDGRGGRDRRAAALFR